MGEQELTGGAGGKPPAAPGTTAGQPQQTSGQVQGQLTGETPQQTQPVNLDDFEQFRRYKSKMDQINAAARQRAEQAERQIGQLRQQVDQLRLQSAAPEEAVAYYEQRLHEMEEQQRQRDAALAQQARYNQKAIDLLQKYDIPTNHPDLDWSGDPTPDGYATLVESINGILAARINEQSQQTEQTVQTATREARQQVIQQTGVSRVTLATGAPQPVNPIADITDPDVLLEMGLLGETGGRRG